jgi:hypothetical protein
VASPRNYNLFRVYSGSVSIPPWANFQPGNAFLMSGYGYSSQRQISPYHCTKESGKQPSIFMISRIIKKLPPTNLLFQTQPSRKKLGSWQAMVGF